MKIINTVKKHRGKLILTVVILVIALFVVNGVRKNLAPKEVETAKAIKGNISQTITASGQVEATDSADIAFGAYGTVVRVNVKEGDNVKKNQALGSVDTASLYQNLQSSQITYQTAVTNLDKAIEAEAQVIATYRDTQETDAIRAAKAQAKQTVDAARQAVDSAKIGINIAKSNLSQATAISPIAGVVVGVNVKVGEEYGASGGTAFQIADISNFKFIVEIDETEIGKIVLGQKVLITLNAFEDREFLAEITKIATAATTDSSGNKVFKVEAALDSSADLLIGLEGDAEIMSQTSENTILVPWEAVEIEGDDYFVYKVENGTAKKAQVEVGLQGEEEYEVLSGLKEGEIIVVNPSEEIKEGTKVNVK